MVSIVAVTAVLINTEPARMAEEAMAADEHTAMPGMEPEEHTGPFEGTVALGEAEAAVTVQPAMPGENTITIAFSQEPENLTEVTASASLPSQNLGPLDLTAKPDRAEPGTYVIERASLSIPGDWELRIEALIGQFDLLTDTVTVPVHGG